jgi:rRNA maturation endonuclease Nob1
LISKETKEEKGMYCYKCGKEIPEGEECPYCNSVVKTEQNEKESSKGSNRIKNF